MTVEETFINQVLDKIPPGPRRAQIEMDLRGHIGERVEHGQSIEEAVRQFGDPALLADSYLAAVPLVSAPFLTRAVAKILDMLLVVLVVFALLFSAWWLLGDSGIGVLPENPQTRATIFIVVCAFALVIWIPAYFVVAEYLTSQTLGKRAMGLRVVKESGARISVGQALLRQLPLAAEIFFLDILFALFTEKSQRAFELISKTRVVRVEGQR